MMGQKSKKEREGKKKLKSTCFKAKILIQSRSEFSFKRKRRQMFLIQVGWLPHGPRALSLWGPHDAAPALSTPWT